MAPPVSGNRRSRSEGGYETGKSSALNIAPLQKFCLGVIQCSSHSISELLRELRLLLAGNAAGARTILCVNAHIYNLAVRDHGLRVTRRVAEALGEELG